MKKAAQIRKALLDGFDPYLAAWPSNGEIRGWNSPRSVFEMIDRGRRVESYLEVGSWLGSSAVAAYQAFPHLHSLVCVDTWLGSAEHWTDQGNPSHAMGRTPDGQPHLYETFLGNMKRAGLKDLVIPLRVPSTIGAQIVAHHQLAFDVIYLDGDHETTAVEADCHAWWPLATKVMMGDDFSDPRFGVAKAVRRFMKSESIPLNRLEVVDGNFWILRK